MSEASDPTEERGVKPRFSAAAGLAFALFATGALVLVLGGNGRAAVSHTCSATDRQFMSVAQLNMADLTSAAEDYLRGDAKAASVIDTASTSLRNVSGTHPEDPSLSKTRAIMRAMFVEYGRAIRAHAHHKNAGKYIYRAYGLANFAHDVLSDARPGLMQRGCDVSPLL